MQSNNKTIAKNTLFLYFRMMFTMVVSLYTSRVVLDVLGINDYGIYQTVGGMVAMLSFINGALSTGSSRFLTFELGTGNKDKLKRTFSTVLIVHALLAILIVVVAETFGLWFVYNKLVIAPERLDAAVIAYHLSIVMAFVTITQVPYGALIISHEKMGIYAYLSIIEVSLKLGIVYLLNISGIDKLVLYASLLCILQVGLALLNRWYCISRFEETKFSFIWDKKIVKDVLGLSGWNLFANTAIALNTHGTVIILNMFFSPAVVTARAIASQVNLAANQFISNFRTAANPQIVKRFAAGDFEGSKNLLLFSTTLSYYMMLMLSMPICLVAEELLNIWLKEVPEYTVIFLQLAVITSLFSVFDVSFYMALYAKGRIRENAMLSPTLGFIQFPIIYVLCRNGVSPLCVGWSALIVNILLGLVVKPYLIIKIVGYKLNDVISVFAPCFKVSIISSIIPMIIYMCGNSIFPNVISKFISLVTVSVLSVGITVWLIGLNKETKVKLVEMVKKKIKR